MIIPYVLILICALTSTALAYLIVKEKDLLVATLLLIGQGISHALLYYLLMAPDLFLTYIPVSAGIIPLLLLLLIKKTERVEL